MRHTHIRTALVCMAVLCLPLMLVGQEDVEVVSFNVVLSPSKEVPPVTAIDTAGTATVEFVITREEPEICEDEDGDQVCDNCDDFNEDGECDFDPGEDELRSAIVDFRVDYVLGEPQVLTGMHIHSGGQGENGPVVINSGLSGPIAAGAGPGQIVRQVRITDPATLDVLTDIANRPALYYLNLHSEANPSGLMRGQLHDTEPGPSPPADLDTVLREISELEAKVDAIADLLGQVARVLGIIPSSTE